MIKILFLGANPSDTTKLALDRELREITQRLRATPNGEQFEIAQEWAVRASDLQAALLRHRPHIVHFSGHGRKAGEIVVQDETGNAAPIRPSALADLFRILGGTVRCVVLNACYSSVQAEAIQRHIGCVVGMSGALQDTASLAFSGALYQALGFGEPFKKAFELGCNQIDLTGLSDVEVPRLLVREGPDPDIIAPRARGNDCSPSHSTPEHYKDSSFSPSLIDKMASFHKAIDKLTADQFRVIDFLRGHTRVSIAGCAGSGKTLVAVEKAMRLDRAGLRVLLLCHNPHLAHVLRDLTAGTTVDVADFKSWVRALALPPSSRTDHDWSHYEEPTDDELSAAFDQLTGGVSKYDAAIVDEGQDFRDTWWTLVEAALTAPQSGLLYIFFDDNQSLLPYRSILPITQCPYSLSRNCRNAGAVFDLVRRIHPCAPEPSVQLTKYGVVEAWRFRTLSEAKSMVARAVGEALRKLPCGRLVVLTTEPGPARETMLHGLNVDVYQGWRWQTAVEKYLGAVYNVYCKDIELPMLGHGPEPTETDIAAVCKSVQKFTVNPKVAETVSYHAARLRWAVTKDAGQLTLRAGQMTLRRISSPVAQAATLLTFFQSPKWADGIPKPESVKIFAGTGDPRDVPLYTAASYKGLESDGVVLFVDPASSRQGATHGAGCSVISYVGISRARLVLHVVTEATSPESLLLDDCKGRGASRA